MLTATYTVDCEAVRDFLEAWHENGRIPYERAYLHLDYDKDQPKTAHDRKKFIALDDGTSGRFLLEKATGLVWTISAYGRPNKRYRPIQLETMTAEYRAATKTHPRCPWWSHRRFVRGMLRDATQGDKASLMVLTDFFEEYGFGEAAHLVREFLNNHSDKLRDLQDCIGLLSILWRNLVTLK